MLSGELAAIWHQLILMVTLYVRATEVVWQSIYMRHSMDSLFLRDIFLYLFVVRGVLKQVFTVEY